MSSKLDSWTWIGSKNLKNLIKIHNWTQIKFKIRIGRPIYIKFLDQNQAQNTSLDSVAANNYNQQPKRNLKSRYETKTGFKVVNWIKKT